jgi:hypothetical protein
MTERIVDIRAFQGIHELILNSDKTSDTTLMAAKIQTTHRLVQKPRHELGLSAHHDQRILQQASLIFHYRRRCHNGRRKDCCRRATGYSEMEPLGGWMDLSDVLGLVRSNRLNLKEQGCGRISCATEVVIVSCIKYLGDSTTEENKY